MRDLIGRTLGHYRIVEKIGEGGMGEVYRAHDEKLDRDVAIKVLPEAVTQDAGRLARFETEAKAVAALNHPNIVTIHSVEEDEGVHFITMELVEGKTLSELIPRKGMPIALIPGERWEGGETRLAKGDTLLLYSDGLVELRNDVGEEFGENRVADVLRRGGPAPEICDNLLRAIEDFHELERLDDDLSLIVLQRRTPR